MARLPRLTIPGQPHHIILRGNNRQPIFLDSADRVTLLAALEEHARRLEVAIHGYVLMSNHFHLLATPRTIDGIPQMMQALGREYVRYFNQRHGRSGTLWEGRYRSTLIQAERYLLLCLAYMDLNPVRAGIVESPGEFAWSSFRHYAGQVNERWISPHALYWQLGNTPFAREAAYVRLVEAGVSAAEEAALTDSALRGWALGEPGYIAQLQAQTERRVSKNRAGRPRRELSPKAFS